MKNFFSSSPARLVARLFRPPFLDYELPQYDRRGGLRKNRREGKEILLSLLSFLCMSSCLIEECRFKKRSKGNRLHLSGKMKENRSPTTHPGEEGRRRRMVRGGGVSPLSPLSLVLLAWHSLLPAFLPPLSHNHHHHHLLFLFLFSSSSGLGGRPLVFSVSLSVAHSTQEEEEEQGEQERRLFLLFRSLSLSGWDQSEIVDFFSTAIRETSFKVQLRSRWQGWPRELLLEHHHHHQTSSS